MQASVWYLLAILLITMQITLGMEMDRRIRYFAVIRTVVKNKADDNAHKCHFKEHNPSYSKSLLRLALGSVRIMCDPRLPTGPIRDIAWSHVAVGCFNIMLLARRMYSREL